MVVMVMAFATTVLILSIYTLPAVPPTSSGPGRRAAAAHPDHAVLHHRHLHSTWWVFVLGVLLLFILFSVFLNLNAHRQGICETSLVLKIPVIKGIVHYAIFERFCRILSSMVAAGVPLTEAPEVTTDATNNKVFIEKLREAEAKMPWAPGSPSPSTRPGSSPAPPARCSRWARRPARSRAS
jgi:type IV pilus assembly protein PilC